MAKSKNVYTKLHKGTTEYETMELEGPYECPHCWGCVMLDVFVVEDKSERKVKCPYCNKVLQVPIN